MNQGNNLCLHFQPSPELPLPGFRKKIPRYTDPEQVEKLKAASGFNAQLMDELRPHVREGTTTDQLDKLAYQYTMDHGHTPACLGYHGYPKTICTSVNEVVCHGIPNDRPLEQGDIVNVDIFAVRADGEIDGKLTAPLRPSVPTLEPGKEYLIEVVIRTIGVGHTLTQGTSDSNQLWLEVRQIRVAKRPVLPSRR